jgi:arabinose-5-phosphate isomerase|tara:strand:- start:214 stop:1155 length:942 start_codon:yes stop_codon:yes gene_type:complete
MSHFKSFIDVFDDEIKSVKNVISNFSQDNINKIIDEILNNSGRLIVSGIGKSGLIGKKIAATLASTGTSSFFIHSTEAYHGDLGMINQNDILLLISYSGESDDVLKVLSFCNENEIKTISVTGNKNSTLAKNSNYFINSNIISEACHLDLAPTSSTTATLIIGDAIAVTLMKAKKFTEADFAKYHPGGKIGKRLLTKVKDVMKTDKLPILDKNMDLSDIIYNISNSGYGIGFLLQNKNIIGVITDGDIRRAIKLELNLKKIQLQSLINKNFKFTRPDSNLHEVKNIMQTNKIITLPVIDTDNTLVGLVQYYDI